MLAWKRKLQTKSNLGIWIIRAIINLAFFSSQKWPRARSGCQLRFPRWKLGNKEWVNCTSRSWTPNKSGPDLAGILCNSKENKNILKALWEDRRWEGSYKGRGVKWEQECGKSSSRRWQGKGNRAEKLDGCGKEGLRSGFGAWKGLWGNAAVIVSTEARREHMGNTEPRIYSSFN